MFRILRVRLARTEAEVIIQYAVKDLNVSTGPNDKGPSQTCFGILLSFPMSMADRAEQKESIEMIVTVRNKVAQHLCKTANRYRQKSKCPQPEKVTLKPGDIVMGSSVAERKWK